MIRVPKKMGGIFWSGLLALVWCTTALAANTPFTDVPNETLFSPHIGRLYQYHLIDGDSTGFHPNQAITRAEMAKLTTVSRLMETYRSTPPLAGETVSSNFVHRPFREYSRSIQSAITSDFSNLSEREAKALISSQNQQLDFRYAVNDVLAPYYACHNQYTQPLLNTSNICNALSTHGTEFTDVPAKPVNCAESVEGDCSPWFGQFVYYAAYKGFISGYSDGTFRPENPMRRIDALKMLLVDDGSIDPEQDARYQRLDQIAKSRNSTSPKCTAGTEKQILDIAGYDQNPESAIRTMKYVFLADRLDFFGANCQLFGRVYTAEGRANYLAQNLTRKEAARFFALSMDYPEVAPDPQLDLTINTAEQNKWTTASQDFSIDYLLQELGQVINENLPLDYLEEDIPQIDYTPLNPTRTELKQIIDEKIKEAEALPTAHPSRTLDPSYAYRSRSNWTVEELILESKTGRCCARPTIDETCKNISFLDYKISEASIPGGKVGQGSLWNQANGTAGLCWIPLDDIYGEETIFKNGKNINKEYSINIPSNVNPLFKIKCPESLSGLTKEADNCTLESLLLTTTFSVSLRGDILHGDFVATIKSKGNHPIERLNDHPSININPGSSKATLEIYRSRNTFRLSGDLEILGIQLGKKIAYSLVGSDLTISGSTRPLAKDIWNDGSRSQGVFFQIEKGNINFQIKKIGFGLYVEECGVYLNSDFTCKLILSADALAPKIKGGGDFINNQINGIISGKLGAIDVDMRAEEGIMLLRTKGGELQILSFQITEDLTQLDVYANFKRGSMMVNVDSIIPIGPVPLSAATVRGSYIIHHAWEPSKLYEEFQGEVNLFGMILDGKAVIRNENNLLILDSASQLHFELINSDKLSVNYQGAIRFDKANLANSSACGEINGKLKVTIPYRYGPIDLELNPGAEVGANKDEIRIRDQVTGLGIRKEFKKAIFLPTYPKPGLYDKICGEDGKVNPRTSLFRKILNRL